MSGWMRRGLAIGSALAVIHVVGPVVWRYHVGPTVSTELTSIGRVIPECWYLGIPGVNVFEHPGPSGICVDKATYDRTPWLSWFDGYGQQRWT